MDHEPITCTVGTGEDTYAAALARAETLRALGSDSVLGPERVILQGETVLARASAPRGVTLASVLAARGALPVGECVWLGVRVATALAQMHRAGLVHGAVDAEAVMIDGSRLAVLDSTLRLGAPTAQSPADDVAALGVMLAEAVRTADRAVLGAWLDPMTAGDPAARPTAAMVAHALVACAHEVQVAMPPADVAGVMRAGAGSAAATRRAGVSDAAARLGQWWRATTERFRAVEGHERQAAGQEGPTGAPHRRPPARTLVLGAIAACAVVILGVVVVAGITLGAGEEPARYGAAGGAAVEPDAVAAAERLTLRRIESLASGDGEALLATVAVGSDAAVRAEEQAGALESGSLAFEGLVGEVEAAELVAAADAGAAVRVTYRTSAHTVIAEGITSERTPQTEVAVLELVLERGRWKVSAATAG